MIHTMESGDIYSISKIDSANSADDNPSLHILLNKLNIPITCLNNEQIRRHYLEEYSAKYSKAKYLLSNARKKQRKIIMNYYEEKEKQDNIDSIQTVKESLLAENDKIKKFKEALKDKLIIYQQRIQFLKDAEFWSALEIQQLQNYTTETVQVYTETSSDSPLINDSLHLLHDHEHIKYSDDHLNDSYPSNTDEHDDSKPSLQFGMVKTNMISLPSEDVRFIGDTFKQQKRSQTQLSTEINGNKDTSTVRTKVKNYFHWLKNYCQLLILSTSNNHFDRFQIISMILMISLAIFLVIFINDLLEHLLNYLTESSVRMTTLSPPESMSKSLFANLLSNISNWTTSWLLPFFRLFDYSL